ncbi:unnamed protein product [Adineta steineri]|uniref:Uncharacterized protein n=1 Tax=Adineta steineri TaxID=433720 RepID=A0A818YR10_9BILA|nr:unnamed protein product [Adineta steineri]CAF1116337.1 unnamed protein product [Adineta steineri]CAF3760107.1 unnamed protein product [Adineta steineri]CAF3777725.1 unnamed protein product [Adineta steineri]
MAQAMFHTKNMINKQSKILTNERQRAMTIDSSLTADHLLPTQSKQRSNSFSNTLHQVVNFVHRKLSRTDIEEKQPFIDS